MTKRKNVVSKMLLLVVILTLISCCFLGSTFARYTTGGEGSGTLHVAKWDVSITGAGTGTTALNFNNLSPSMEEYDAVEQTPRTHSTAVVAVAAIEYDLEVEATLTFTVGELTFKNNDADVTYGEGYDVDDLKEVFSITFYSDNGTTEISVENGTFTKTLSGQGTLDIYAKVTWTSDTEGVTGAAADQRDTWIGANVTTVSCTFEYTAEQATQIPA